LIAN
jgi:hypothetical protein